MEGGALIFLRAGILALGLGWPFIKGKPSLPSAPIKLPSPSPSMPGLPATWLLDRGRRLTDCWPRSSNDMGDPPGGTWMLPATTSLLAPVTPRIVLLRLNKHRRPRKAKIDASLKIIVCSSVSTIVTATECSVIFCCRRRIKYLLSAPPPVTSRIFSSRTGPRSSPATYLSSACLIWSVICSTHVRSKSSVLYF